MRSHLLLLTLILLIFNQSDLLGQITVDENDYTSIKKLVEVYASADDLMDEKLLVARSRVRDLGPSAAPALMRLFMENQEDRYREAIIDALEYNKTSYAVTVPFVTRQLQGPSEDWKGIAWIVRAMEFLSKADQASAQVIAAKAVVSKEVLIRSKAENILQRAEGPLEDSGNTRIRSSLATSGLGGEVGSSAIASGGQSLTSEASWEVPWIVVTVVLVALMALVWLIMKSRSRESNL